MSSLSSDKLISVVVPVFNEEEVLPVFHQRLSAVLNSIPIKSEIIYVNDGSFDNSLAFLNDLRNNNKNISIIDLSRNFGKEVAVTAGIDYANGDAAVIIDADLQDPPELIAEFIRLWEDGYDVVYAKRVKRKGDTFFKKITAYIFYRLIQKFSNVYLPEDTGDYRLLSRRAVNSIRKIKEKHRFMKGLFSYIGYAQISVEYQRDSRYAGKTKWNYFGLWNLALEGITSFTTAPLKLATYSGLIAALGAFIYAMIIIYKTIAYGEPVKGYPSLMVVILFLGGIQLVTIGLVGEYLGRIFNETKRRPLYFINSFSPSIHAKKHERIE